MSEEAVKARRYDNSGRAARAEATRRAILEAGRKVLVDKGYGGTTMAAIARAAGVSVETVYKSFGSKLDLLGEILNHAVVGDDAPVPLAERPEYVAAQQAGSGAAVIAGLCELSCRILERVGPLIATIFVAARAGEADLKPLAKAADRAKHADYRGIVEAVAATGDMRPELSVEEATDIFATIGSPEVYLQLRDDRGWTHERYGRWLTQTAQRLLLADDGRVC